MDDTPVGVWGESGGPGDDVRIEFGGTRGPAEVQAKFGPSTKLGTVVERIRKFQRADAPVDVALVVDRTAPKKLITEVRQDLERVRTGRTDGLRPDVSGIRASLGEELFVLEHLHVHQVDVVGPGDADRKEALRLLRDVLEAPEHADAAWSVLTRDAGDLCKNRARRTRKDLVDLLTGKGFKVRPPPKDNVWHRQLDFCRDHLLSRGEASAALSTLQNLEHSSEEKTVERLVRYRIASQKAIALIALNRPSEALVNARKALEIDPDGVHALVNAAVAATSLGKLDLANEFAERATTRHPTDPHAWSASAYVAAARSAPLPAPGPSIADSAIYKMALVQIAADHGEHSRVLDLTAGLLRSGERSPHVLFHRANTLIASPTGKPAEDNAAAEDAERLATELIELCADGHPLRVKAFVIRSGARRRLGHEAAADSDLDAARAIDSEDPDALRHLVESKIQREEIERALELLHHPIVDETPLLRAIRAYVYVRRKNEDAATKDLTAALQKSEDFPSPEKDKVHLAALDAAVRLSDKGLVGKILASISPTARTDAAYWAALGRLAFAQGHVDEGTEQFRRAASSSLATTNGYLSELGDRLLRANRAAVRTGELAAAQRVVEELASKGTLPTWALTVATDLALRQEDISKAIDHLAGIVDAGEATPYGRIVLARCLIEGGRASEAGGRLEPLLVDTTLSATERMEIGQLLYMLGRPRDALTWIFGAFRDAPHDPRLHRALIMLALSGKLEVENVTAIGDNTYVRLQDQEGQIRAHTIYSSGPVDPSKGEMRLGDATTANLVGKKVGDSLIERKGQWDEQRWTVDEILPAWVHVARQAMENYPQSFPSEDFFLRGFRFNEETPSVRDFSPLIASVEARKAHVDNIYSLYRSSTLPLGFVSELIGEPIADVMEVAAANPDTHGPLFIEWGDQAGQAESRSAATEAREVVLTRSALKTAGDLDLLGLLETEYTWLAPRALLTDLKSEVDKAERVAAKGQTLATMRDSRPLLQSIPAEHPYLQKKAETLLGILNWVEKHVRIEPRPLETIHPMGSQEEQGRDRIGHGSADAVALVQHFNGTLYADDLGLRRFFTQGTLGRSFSTVGLLYALASQGRIGPAERDSKLVKLAVANHVYIAPTTELLTFAVRNSFALGRQAVAQVFLTLAAPPELTPDESARIVSEVLRAEALASVQLIPIEALTSLALNAMSKRWPRPLCATLLSRTASDRLRLLPRQLKIVHEACAAHGKP